MSLPPHLLTRSAGRCELCGATSGLAAYPVAPRTDEVVLCTQCLGGARSAETGDPLDSPHWVCLRESAWSEHPAVQVMAWRLLGDIHEPWASDLRDQLYLDDDTRTWAESAPSREARVKVVDSHGAELFDGDAVTLIKDLDVKGAGFTAKRGTLVKGIRLGTDPALVEGRVNGVAIYLRTEFLKRA